MNKPNRKEYLTNIFTRESEFYKEAVLLGEQELALSEKSLEKRKQDLLQVRLKYQLAKAELESIK